MTCKFLSIVMHLPPNAFGNAHAVSKCETHNWMMEYAVCGETMCPLGRIEQARDEAIQAIKEATP